MGILGNIYVESKFVPLALVVVGIVLAIVFNIIFGGFKVGRLIRRLQLTVPHEQFPDFLARMNQRLAELGFQSEGGSTYFQGGQMFGVPTTHTHAKSGKYFEFTADQTDPRHVKVELSIRYKDAIVGDTGESTYADAVMKYVSNETDSMRLVANRSFMAFCSLALAFWSWAVLFGLKLLHVEPFLAIMITLTVTTMITSIIAIVTIALKPAELSGIWLAILGLIVSGAALAASIVLVVLPSMR